MNVPPVEMSHGSDEVCVAGDVGISVGGTEIVSSIQSLIGRVLGLDSSTSSTVFPVRMCVPCIRLDVADLHMQATGESISLEGSDVRCERLFVSETTGVSASCFGVKATLGEVCVARVDCIDTLYVPGAFSFERPVKDVMISMTTEAVRIEVDSVNGTLLQSDDPQTNISSNSGELSVPFPIHLAVRELKIKTAPCSEELGVPACVQDKGMKASLSRIRAILGSRVMVMVDEVAELHIPGSFDLTEPLRNPELSLSDGVLQVNINSAHITLDEFMKDHHTVTRSESSIINIPFPV
jgi:hypothetical protein